MAQELNLSCFLLPLLLISTPIQARHEHPRSGAQAFIEFQCKATLYPDFCIRSLSFYTTKFAMTTPSHQQLAQIVIMVCLSKAESTRAYVAKQLWQTKAKDYRAVKECLEQINDGVDQLTKSMKERRRIREGGEESIGEFSWRASNLQTGMSAVVTDASMCLERFSGQAVGDKTKRIIKAKVMNLQRATSNALALFNRFAARYICSCQET